MTNLLILYPDVQQAATRYINYTETTSETKYHEEDSPFLNCMRGERYQHWRSDTSAERQEHYGRWDLGPTTTKSCNFVVLARLDYLRSQADTINFVLQSSSNDSSWTDRHSITDIDTATLKGPWSNDYVSTFTTTSAFRYWRAAFVGNGVYNLRISKIYCGTAFDMGRDPIPVKVERHRSGTTAFETSGGILYPGRIRNPTYEIILRWEGVTDSVVQSFYENIVTKRHTTSFFLHTTGFHEILENTELLHVKMDAPTVKQQYEDWNIIQVRFFEIHG